MQTTTIAAAKKLKLQYFSAWFCPFAHRSTIALEHHNQSGTKFIDFEWQEALGWENRPPTGKEEFDAEDRKDWIYHWKSPELLKCNPLGMIPTLLEESTGRSVTESVVCIEFIDEIARNAGSTQSPLLPLDSFEKAQARVMAERMNKKVTSSYYTCLVREDKEERQQAFNTILSGLEEFVNYNDSTNVDSGNNINIVDCVLFPYAWRLYVLEHYRGFSVPQTGSTWIQYHKWLDNMSNLEHVKKTLPDVEKYLIHVEKYASGRARSKVGNAVRRGKAADNYADDE